MAVKFYRLRSCFVLAASFAKFSHFRIIFNHLRPSAPSIMPRERKAVAVKEKPVEDAPAEPKRGRAAKKVDDIASEHGGTNGDAKPKRARPTKTASTDSKPKTARGKKPVEQEEPLEEEEREETPPVEPKEKKGRGRKAAKAPVELEEEIEDDEPLEEPKEKKTRGRRAAKEVLEPEEDREETPPAEVKEKRGRARKAAAPKVEEDVEESDEEPEIKKPKARGRAKKEAPSTSKSEGLMNPTETGYEEIDFTCTKENKLGHKPNMVIASWNVDGLRAWLKKDGLKYIEFEKPDVFCVQESKCSTDKLPDDVVDLEGYHKYWENSDKEGYAGVGLFSRTEPLNVEYGIGVPEHDEEGRCITAEFEKFYVVTVYVPNAGKKLVTLPKRLEWNKAFKTYIKELDKKKPVIICGDMNVAHSEIDLANPKANAKNAGFTKEEREGMTAFLGDGYVDTYRKLYPDQTGAYTFWTYMMKSRSKNVGWRLDYFLVSERFMDNICDNVIRSEVLGSDHCPIVLFINV